MSRNPQLRGLVLRGYIKLAAFAVALCLLLLPMIFIVGVGGAQTTQVACGVLGLVLAVWQALRK